MIENSKLIKVLLVDDSPTAIALIKKMLSDSLDIKVVGTACNGKEAIDLIPLLKPDVVCIDLFMPVMDGTILTKEIMAKYPRPILIISSHLEDSSQNIFKILEAGALDTFAKPKGISNLEIKRLSIELVSKIRIISGVHVFKKVQNRQIDNLNKSVVTLNGKVIPRIVVIGASTGGPQALQAILSNLPANFPIPIVCIQHISDGFLKDFISWLSSQCKLKVSIAKSGELPLRGTIYFPQEGTHLKFDNSGRFYISLESPFQGHKPSITVTMNSAAAHFGKSTIGILLTGMGADGAEGMKCISLIGGITIAQDEETCVVFGMPKQAIELGAAQYVMPLSDISSNIMKLVNL
ncbi:MAG: chemotaxis-specific protein-glutamate methyltransferase CheB [Desulfobacterales bacterium]|nr:chemotaxis-specific protein-glutamate methyltransferase CheB [Desulfobacterales bacterium]MBF0396999.1 chemotaxis-specific protein-glutamate methyltransferase CheB [Desulfobacterales bacterium]